jgi:peptidoglycan/LPS O-acetylase OafA/YrhL
VVIAGHASYPIAWIPSDLGVAAFFVLSGFLITRLLLREFESTGGVSLRGFYARRTLRIFPAYYAFVFISFVLDYLRHERWSPSLTASGVTYLMNYYNALHGHPNTSLAHAWSLAVEEQFYLLWPLAFVLVAPGGRRRIAKLLLTLTAAVLVWRSWLYLHVGVGPAYIYNALDCRFDNLAVGCLLAVIVDDQRALRVGEALARRAWYPVVTLVALLAARRFLGGPLHYSIGFTLYAVLIAVLLVQLMQLHIGRMWGWLEHPVVRYLGLISYPLYLWHAWGSAIGRHIPIHSRHVEFWGGVAATIALASGSYFVIERPFLALKRHFASHRPPRRGTTTPEPVLASEAHLPNAATSTARAS